MPKRKSLMTGLMKSLGENAQVFAEMDDSQGFIDTGSYTLNGLICGDMFGGVPKGKRLVFAGKSTTGKTFLMLNIMDSFLDAHPNNHIALLESEDATTLQMAEQRFGKGSEKMERIVKDDVLTVKDVQERIWNLVDWWKKSKDDADGGELLIGLDSIGQMMGNKEYADMVAQKIVSDMGTRAKEIKACFRAIGAPMSWEGITFIATNHTYQSAGMYPTEEMAGGEGVKFVGDIIVFLAKSKIEGTSKKDIIGNTIYCKNNKNRFAKEHAIVGIDLLYDGGISRYAGLLQMGEKIGAISSVNRGNKGKHYVYRDVETPRKVVEENPQEFFTQELLEEINEFVKANFKYGGQNIDLDFVGEVELE